MVNLFLVTTYIQTSTRIWSRYKKQKKLPEIKNENPANIILNFKAAKNFFVLKEILGRRGNVRYTAYQEQDKVYTKE